MFPELSYLLLQATGNVTNGVSPVSMLQGNWWLVLGAVGLIIGTFIILYIFKHLIANAIVGILALLAVVYLIGMQIPINALTVLISIFGGLGGVGALLIAAFFGWI